MLSDSGRGICTPTVTLGGKGRLCEAQYNDDVDWTRTTERRGGWRMWIMQWHAEGMKCHLRWGGGEKHYRLSEGFSPPCAYCTPETCTTGKERQLPLSPPVILRERGGRLCWLPDGSGSGRPSRPGGRRKRCNQAADECRNRPN